MLKFLIISISVLLSFSASATKPKDKEFIREGDRLIQKGSYGQKLYHEQQYQIKDGKICPIKNGSIEHHKPCIVIENRK
jgi:hypothetical protein